jgi:hypothetical protein
MAQDKPITELEWFAAWAVMCGHYPVADLIANFKRYQAGLVRKREEDK